MSEIKHISEKDKDFVTQTNYVAQIPDVEARVCVQVDKTWTDQKGVEHDASYLQIRFLDDQNDTIFTVRDKNLEHAKLYERGHVGTLTLAVTEDVGFKGRTRIYVTDFKVNAK